MTISSNSRKRSLHEWRGGLCASLHSSAPRFHLVNPRDGMTRSHLVAQGRACSRLGSGAYRLVGALFE